MPLLRPVQWVTSTIRALPLSASPPSSIWVCSCIARTPFAQRERRGRRQGSRRCTSCGGAWHSVDCRATPTLAMSLFDIFVRPVMSYGVEVWGPQLVVAALAGRAPDTCEKVHLDFLRRLLGVRDTCCALTVQAETGRLPIVVGWAQQVARFVNRLTVLDDSRVAKQAMLDSVALAATGGAAGSGRQCWAA